MNGLHAADDDPVIQAIEKERDQYLETLAKLTVRRLEITQLLQTIEQQIAIAQQSFAEADSYLDNSKQLVQQRYTSFGERYNVSDSGLIASLQDIILEELFSYVSPHRVCSCVMMVCKRWHKIVMSSQDLWRMWCAREMLFGKVDPLSLLQYNRSQQSLRYSSIDYKSLMESLYKTEKQWKKTTPIKSLILPCVFSKQDDEDESFVNLRINKKNMSVCSATTTGVVCEWDMRDGDYRCLHAHRTKCSFDDVEFFGNHFVSTEYSTVSVWNMASGECLQTQTTTANFTALCVAETVHGDTIFTASGSSIQAWSLNSQSLACAYEFAHSCYGSVQHFAYKDNILVSVAPNSIMVWDIRMRTRLRVLDEKAHYVVFNGSTIVALEGYGTVLKMIELFHDPAPLKIKLPSLCSFSWGMCLEGNKLVLPFGACVDVLDIRRVGDVFPSLDFNYFVNYVDTYVGYMFCGLENGSIQCMEF